MKKLLLIPFILTMACSGELLPSKEEAKIIYEIYTLALNATEEELESFCPLGGSATRTETSIIEFNSCKLTDSICDKEITLGMQVTRTVNGDTETYSNGIITSGDIAGICEFKFSKTTSTSTYTGTICSHDINDVLELEDDEICNISN